MKWISVKDRLPRNGQRVLVFCTRGFVVSCMYEDDKFGKGFQPDDTGNPFIEIDTGEDRNERYTWFASHWTDDFTLPFFNQSEKE